MSDTAVKRIGRSRLVLPIVVAVVVALAVWAVTALVLGGDAARDAKAGDCIASDEQVADEGTTETGANVVDCSSDDARFSVVARVDGESSTQSKACDKFFQQNEEFYVFANSAGKGYVLCLKPAK
ncbi:LppU/SCO3897 family protein [Actinoplanes sp. URMC 104]|uniref:LppU/SCO3897 family protein n=1 Tax=Actinoplanes sp. URMC 104 TaxID=3423409 RepID=UPI003F1C5F2B